MLDNKHPQYVAKIDEVKIMRDTYNGSTYIKKQGEKYLKPLTSMLLDNYPAPNSTGARAYNDYRHRAIFYEYVRDAVHTHLGLLHQKEAVIHLPAQLEYMLEKASNLGESLQELLRRINENQLLTGRCGLLLDLPLSENGLPYIALYSAESIINWDNSISATGVASYNMVVLDESGLKFNPVTFSWDTHDQYRVLSLGSIGQYEEKATYKQGVFENNVFDEKQMFEISYSGQPLNQIPFVIVNSTDITSEFRTPPLKIVADLSISIYNSEADYRQNLHQQGQDTLVVINGPKTGEPLRIGAGARIDLDSEGDAKYIGVGSNGLAEQREALTADKELVMNKSGTFIGTKQSSQESGEAMQTRIASRTVTLVDVAMTGAVALETILKMAAEWIGADPSKVSVEPNTEFAKQKLNAQDIVQLQTTKNIKGPISQKTIHDHYRAVGLTNLTYEEELELIAQEKPEQFPLLIEQIDKSTGQQVGGGNSDPTPSDAKTNVDKRP